MSSLLDLLKNKQKELAAKKSRDNTVKLPGGNSRWRILPHWSGDENAGLPSHDYGKHFVKDFSGELQAIYICTSKTFGKSCPVCDSITKGELAASDENAKNLLANAKAAQRYLVNAVQKSDKGYSSDVVILELPSGAFNDVLSLAAQFASDGINIFSLAEGYDVIFNREGTGLKTKYKAMLAPRSNPIDNSFMTKAINLEEYVQQEYEEGKTKALVAISNVAGASTPMLPSSMAAKSAEVLPARGTATAAPTITAAAASDDLSIDLSEVDLSDLEMIES
jgi:gp32 DNA binding protein like